MGNKMTTSTRYCAWLLGAAVLAPTHAQTRIDLRTQGKSVDFSTVPTKPFRTDTTLPATCSVGETFFKTDAPAGKNFYGCTATNTWTLQTEAAPELPDATGQNGKVLTNDGSGPQWSVMNGDVSGTAGALLVQGLQGRTISTVTPADGDVVKWNAPAQRWEPAATKATMGGDASGSSDQAVVRGMQGRAVSAAAPSDGQTLRWNASANQWEPGLPSVSLSGDATGSTGSTVVRRLQGRAVSATAPTDGQGLKWNAAANTWEPGAPAVALGGDASGANSNVSITGLRGRAISNSVPADGQALKWNASSSTWEPGAALTVLSGDATGTSNSTVVQAVQGNKVSNRSPIEGQALKWNATTNQWEPGVPSITLAGDSTGPAGSNRVTGLQGRAVAQTAPTNGAALTWNGSTNQWEPAALEVSVAGDANGPFSHTVVQALQGRAVSATKPTDGQALTWNGALNQWQPSATLDLLTGDARGPANATVVTALQERALSAAAPADGQNLKWNSQANQWEPGAANLAGDASGPSGSTTVRALQGRAVAAATPADGQVLKWNAASSQWAPGDSSGLLSGDASGSAASTIVKGLQGRPLSAIAPTDGDGLRWNAASSQWEPGSTSAVMGGDASGPAANATVRGLQGRTLSSAAPTNGQVLRWNATSNQWEPGGQPGNYSAAFTAQTNLIIPGAGHGYESANLLVACYDANNTTVEPGSVSINPSTYDVTVTFQTAQTGRCVINGSSGSGGVSSGGGSSPIISIFGRTGVVTAQQGDYSFPQISGTVSSGQLAGGIDAGKIGAGTVSSTAFGALANVRSDIQAQMDGKAALGHSHTAAGDVTGDLGTTAVTAIQHQPVAAIPANDGQVLTWKSATGRWEPQDAAAGGAGGALSVLAVEYTSPTTLTIGGACSATAPCNVRIGSIVRSIRAASTATISGGSGAAYVYVDQTGTLTVGHNLTVACSSGCLSQRGISAFPTDAIPIATWSASNGSWDQQGQDWRSWLSTNVVMAGTGIMVIDSGQSTTVAVDAAVVPTYLKETAVLDFPAIADRSCSSDMTFPLAGATPGDAVAAGWPGTLPGGIFGTMFVSELDTISVRLCNLSGISINPAPASYNATIIRSM
jgi:hypothetical protein